MVEKSQSDADELLAAARAKAVASPLRLRILRICLHEAHTNQEIATALELNPGTVLHHVRSLVETGFLRAEPPRPGPRGRTEIPYLATRLSWRHPAEGIAPILVDTFLADIDGLDAEEIQASRLGLKLVPERLHELRARFDALLQEYAATPADPDGEAVSIFLAIHPDRSTLPGGRRRPAP